MRRTDDDVGIPARSSGALPEAAAALVEAPCAAKKTRELAVSAVAKGMLVQEAYQENMQSLKDDAADLAEEARRQAAEEAARADRRAQIEARVRAQVEAEMEQGGCRARSCHGTGSLPHGRTRQAMRPPMRSKSFGNLCRLAAARNGAASRRPASRCFSQDGCRLIAASRRCRVMLALCRARAPAPCAIRW